MSILEATGIYIQCLLKISFEILIGLIGLAVIMAIVSWIKGDKCLFSKIYCKLRRHIYGK